MLCPPPHTAAMNGVARPAATTSTYWGWDIKLTPTATSTTYTVTLYANAKSCSLLPPNAYTVGTAAVTVSGTATQATAKIVFTMLSGYKAKSFDVYAGTSAIGPTSNGYKFSANYKAGNLGPFTPASSRVSTATIGPFNVAAAPLGTPIFLAIHAEACLA